VYKPRPLNGLVTIFFHRFFSVIRDTVFLDAVKYDAVSVYYVTTALTPVCDDGTIYNDVVGLRGKGDTMCLRVKELAEAKGWDIYRMCSEAKLTLTTMQKVWVASTVEIPNVESKTLQKLADALGIDMKDLYA
jgi:hypothetical protein